MKNRTLHTETLESRRLLALNPTGAEQELLQLVNRFRSAPAAEFSHMFSSVSPLRARDATVQTNVDFFGTNGAVLRSELQALQAAPPLAWNEAIYDFAKSHNSAMIGANPPSQFHSNTTVRRQTLIDAGVNFRIVSGEKINSENVYAYANSPSQLLAAYVVDWGPGSNGMLNGRGHRTAIINDDFEQIGQAITPFSGGGLGPLINTQVLANIEDPPVMAVGALFEDENSSGWYESGEGIGSAKIEFQGPEGTFSTTSFGAGGYQIELPVGTYRATATGGGMKHAVTVEDVTIGSVNKWLDLIYDPTAIPADALESNNTRGTASPLTSSDQTISQLSIHTPSDADYFRLVPEGTGAASFSINFTHSAGDLSLRVTNSSGTVIASAASSTNNESLSVGLSRGQTYYVEVSSVGSATNGNYSLTVKPPKAAPPVAAGDSGHANNATRTASINILSNDSDPDGDPASLVAKLEPGTSSAFQLTGGTVDYTAPAGFSGFATAHYRVTDDQDLTSGVATISIFVVDFEHETPWKNIAKPLDSNGDNSVAPNDVLLVVNELNARNARRLPTSHPAAGPLAGFVDTNGDGFISPIDVLRIVNHLNAGGGEGEDSLAAHDAAVEQLAGLSALPLPERRNPWDFDRE